LVAMALFPRHPQESSLKDWKTHGALHLVQLPTAATLHGATCP